MIPTFTLWLPILLSAVFVFIASSLVHMLLKYHGGDFSPLPSEDEVLEDLRKHEIPPGEYYMPYLADFKDRENPGYKAKLEKGPVGFMTICGPDYEMGKSLALWFVYSLLVSLLTAHLAGLALGPGAAFGVVMHHAGILAFMGYAVALIQQSIWYKRAWGTTVKYMIDGLLYAVVTGATFAWLWPAA